MEIVKTILITLGAGTILSLLFYKQKKLAGIITFVSMVIILYNVLLVAAKAFSEDMPLQIKTPLFLVPVLNAKLIVFVDKLSAIFLVIICLVCCVAVLYSIGYMDIYHKENFAKFYPLFLLFVGGMMGVVSTKDMFFFLVFWEFMTLTSYILVIFESDNKEVLRAGFKYFIMTHIGTAFLFVAVLILYGYSDGSFRYEDFKVVFANLIDKNPVVLYLVLSFLLVGFGTKAGMYPLGTWLPDAHPAAPSGISAILSGIMIKLGIYGILRTFIWMLPVSEHSIYWGVIIATCGVISIVMGNLSAIVQKEYKRMLAHSSIGQIGYILLATGVSVAFIKTNPEIAVISLIAGLYHLINHSFFKGLLFLNAGSILYATGKKDLNEIGGLWKIMPSVVFYTLVACFAIAGVPPLSGFASKWLIYQVSVLGGIQFPLFILYALIAIFFSIITLAYGVKFLSSAFFGNTPDEIQESDIPFSMRLSQGIFTGITILLGIVPLFALILCYSSLYNSVYGAVLRESAISFDILFGGLKNGIVLTIGGYESGIFRPIVISVVFMFCVVLAYFISRLGGAKKRLTSVWYCGEKYNKDEVRYKASSFYLPIQVIFEKWLFPPMPTLKVGRPERMYKTLDFDRLIYYPFVSLLIRITSRFRKTHVGIPQTYMLWQVVGIILVIVVLFLII